VPGCFATAACYRDRHVWQAALSCRHRHAGRPLPALHGVMSHSVLLGFAPQALTRKIQMTEAIAKAATAPASAAAAAAAAASACAPPQQAQQQQQQQQPSLLHQQFFQLGYKRRGVRESSRRLAGRRQVSAAASGQAQGILGFRLPRFPGRPGGRRQESRGGNTVADDQELDSLHPGALPPCHPASLQRMKEHMPGGCWLKCWLWRVPGDGMCRAYDGLRTYISTRDVPFMSFPVK